MASVRIEKLCKTFDEKTNVVDDVSVCIRDNEFVVIVGPSGCGKTTTLNIIAGLEKPSSGHIFIDDECVDDVEPKDRNIAMVFQTHTLYPHLSVKDNLAFPLRIRRCDKELIEQRVSSTAEMLGISDLNSLLFPLIIIQSQEKMTLSVYINSIGSSYTSDYGAFMLALSLATLPIILLFIVVQKHFRMGMRGI